MLKRSVAALLWFYAGWYAGAMIAYFAGITEILGPILGTAAAAIFAGDPRGIIWVRETPEVSTADAAPRPRRKRAIGPA